MASTPAARRNRRQPQARPRGAHHRPPQAPRRHYAHRSPVQPVIPGLNLVIKLLRRQVVQFMLVGLTVMVLGLGVLFLLVELVGLRPDTAKIVELGLSIQLNYLGNRFFTWQGHSRGPWWHEVVRFNVSRLVTAGLSWLVFIALTNWWAMNYVLASVLSVVLAMAANYVAARYWVFGNAVSPRWPGWLPRARVVKYSKLVLPVLVVGLVGYYGSLVAIYYLAIAILVVVQVFVATSSLALKLHAWNTPENLDAVGFDIPKAPAHSFSLIYPVRDEEYAVILASITSLATQNHPDVEVIMVVSGDDDEETRHSVERVQERFSKQTRVVYVFGPAKNKPKALMEALPACTKEIVGIFDAESLAAQDILINVDTKFQDTGADTVVSGVQLMNFRDSWYSLQNCLEYYWWFKSRLHYQASKDAITYPGNTLFIKRQVLEAVGGWDVTNQTEDADLGIRMSAAGYKTVAVYDPKLVTREETPDSVAAMCKQRTRWMQGFFQTYLKGDWRQLPRLQQRLLARYTLTMPFVQAIAGVLVPISAVAAVWLKLPVVLALATFLPLVPALTTMAVDMVALRYFGTDYQLKVRIRDYFKLVVGSFPFQFILSWAAVRAALRQLRGQNDWLKTKHSGNHHQASDGLVPVGDTV